MLLSGIDVDEQVFDGVRDVYGYVPDGVKGWII